MFLMTFPLWVSCCSLKIKLHPLFETCKPIHFDSSMHTLYLFTLQFLLMFACKQSVSDTYLPGVIKQLLRTILRIVIFSEKNLNLQVYKMFDVLRIILFVC